MATESMRGIESMVPAARRRSSDSPLSARYSIRVRLPLLISALLAGTVAKPFTPPTLARKIRDVLDAPPPASHV